MNAIDPLETTERKEVTAIGEPSYTSAVHKWKGTTESLKANAETKKTKASTCSGAVFKASGNLIAEGFGGVQAPAALNFVAQIVEFIDRL